MKIYKMNVNTTQPTKQVLAMQQNSVGMLSVDVTKDGKYIRNLSCSLYEGDNEISATAENGYKIDMGDKTKVVKFKAKSVPIESTYETILSAPSGNRNVSLPLARLQIKPGVYNQDEFLPCLKMVPNYGYATFWNVNSLNLSSTNFSGITFAPWNPNKQISFRDTTGTNLLPNDVKISADAEISCFVNQLIKTTGAGAVVKKTHIYPSVGYWTDNSYETVIKPSMNAACYAEADISEPTVSSDVPAEEPPAETED